MRLDKYLSNSGYGSRKEVKFLIKHGQVKVNEQIIKDDSFHVMPEKDLVFVNDLKVNFRQNHYILLYKPEGYISSTEDESYPSVLNLVNDFRHAALFPVGRLDVDTTGVLLLTDDGDLAHRLLSPKRHVNKVYRVTVDHSLSDKLIDYFKVGILLDGKKTLPATLTILSDLEAEVILNEGRFHQVKRMFSAFNYTVVSLKRIQFDCLTLKGLNVGEYRLLSESEIEKLKNH